MTLHPDFVTLETILVGENFNQICRNWIEALTQQGFPSIVGWAIPFGEPSRPGGLKQALESLTVGTGVAESPDSIEFQLGYDKSYTVLYQPRDSKDWVGKIYLTINGNNIDLIHDYLYKSANLCRYLIRDNLLINATFYRFGGGLSCIPDVPLAGKSHLIVVSQAEVEESYERPEVFWQAGWNLIEQYGDDYLLLRGMNASDDVSFLREIMPHQWAMARAAKSGLTKYFFPQPKPEEMPIFQTEESYLNPVGYIPDERVVEYACWVDESEHIQGWEIFKVWKLIQAKRLSDGRPVDTVRIVFPNREIAEQEKRPLLDVGAKVWYYNSVGETEEIME